MLKAFVSNTGSIVPFKHITFVIDETQITIKVYYTNEYISEISFKSEQDKEQQIKNFIEYLTDYEEDTL